MSKVIDYRESVQVLEELKEQFKELQVAVAQYADLLNQYELAAHDYTDSEAVDDEPDMTSDEVTSVLDEVMAKDGE